jgi:hypothetical protein
MRWPQRCASSSLRCESVGRPWSAFTPAASGSPSGCISGWVSTNRSARLDISFYRDDFTRIGVQPQVRPRNCRSTVDGRHLLLVDDVLYTGRTIRAALNELFDYGRPASVLLAVLVDRGGGSCRSSPMCVASGGSPGERIKLPGPHRCRCASNDRPRIVGRP